MIQYGTLWYGLEIPRRCIMPNQSTTKMINVVAVVVVVVQHGFLNNNQQFV